VHAPRNAQERGDIRKDFVVFAHFLIKRIGEEVPAFVGEVIGHTSGFTFAEEHQLVRCLHRKRLEKHRIDQTEDGRVGSNAQRERKHRNQGEAGLLQEHPHSVTQILKHFILQSSWL
jgi:hypothetical protein